MSVLRVPVHEATRHEVTVDGLTTSYLECGSGEPLLLLHSGEYGASAELSWEYAIAAFSQSYRVIAPDWLGYGDSAKVHDFVAGTGRLVSHMRRFCDHLSLGAMPMVGSSLGASMLLSDASAEEPQLRASAIVAICGGGEVARNAHVDALFDYDGSVEAMRLLVAALFEGPEWLDEEYVRRRHAQSISPGAWECVSAPRFRAPARAADAASKQKPDYSRIQVPTLLVAGDRDKIKPSSWAQAVQAQVPDCSVYLALGCGHLPHLEQPDLINEVVLQFLKGH